MPSPMSIEEVRMLFTSVAVSKWGGKLRIDKRLGAQGGIARELSESEEVHHYLPDQLHCDGRNGDAQTTE